MLAVEADSLGSSLVWEASRGGDLFPHLYGVLAADAVVAVIPTPPDEAAAPGDAGS